jgi:hypothetical protein
MNIPHAQGASERASMPSSTPALLRKLGVPNEMRMDSHYDAPDEGLDHETAWRIASETDMARKIATVLNFYYPGHAWEVTVDSRHGGAQLRIAILMTGSQCFFMRFDDIATHNDFRKRVRDAGGELLERFNIPRAGFDLTAFIEAQPKAVLHINQRVPE